MCQTQLFRPNEDGSPGNGTTAGGEQKRRAHLCNLVAPALRRLQFATVIVATVILLATEAYLCARTRATAPQHCAGLAGSYMVVQFVPVGRQPVTCANTSLSAEALLIGGHNVSLTRAEYVQIVEAASSVITTQSILGGTINTAWLIKGCLHAALFLAPLVWCMSKFVAIFVKTRGAELLRASNLPSHAASLAPPLAI